MRAKEVPRLLFDMVIEGNPRPPRVNFNNAFYEILFIGRAHAIICYEELNKRKPNVTSVKIWYFPHAFKQDDILQCIAKEQPVLIISGGPHYGHEWKQGFGKKLIELVKVRFGYPAYNGGFELNNPILPLLTEVIEAAHEIVNDNPVVKLTYWEAYKDPGAWKYQKK